MSARPEASGAEPDTGRASVGGGGRIVNRKQFLGLAAAAASTHALAAPAAPAIVRRRRPNILLIVSDQEQSFVDLPRGLPLPGHERLLERGTGFANHHVTTTPCGPSRSVLYTGLHTQATGVYANPNMAPHPQLSAKLRTVGHMLRDQGYYTAYKGKWHLSLFPEAAETDPVHPSLASALEPYGFADWNFDGDHTGHTWTGFQQDPVIAADSRDLLQRLKQIALGGQPWFLAVNFVNAHDIMFFDATGEQERTRLLPGFIAPLRGAPDNDLYRARWAAALPASLQDDLTRKPWAQRDERARLDAVYGGIDPGDLRAWRAFRDYYFNCIRDMDRHLVTVLNALQATDQEQDTIVVFTADHAERAGAHGLRQKGVSMYKENLRVPLIIRHPDLRGGKITERLSSGLDLTPTLLGLAGVDAAARAARYPQLKGVDVSPLVADPRGLTERDRRGVLFDYEYAGGWDTENLKQRLVALREGRNPATLPPQALDRRVLFRGIHDGRYKFARYFAPSQHHTPLTWAQLTAHNDLELYDTIADPDELDNLAFEAAPRQALILELNRKLNGAMAVEVGLDDGASLPGPREIYNRLGA